MKITLLAFTILFVGLATPGALALTYSPDVIHTEGGIHASGNIFSLEAEDGDLYVTTEVTALPYLDVRMNFTGIPDLVNTSLQIRGFYDGNPAHEVNITLWDGLAWVDLDTMPDDATRTVTSFDLDPTDYILNGSLQVRFYHVQSGSAGHTLELDLLRLEGDLVPDMIDTALMVYLVTWGALIVFGYLVKQYPLIALGSLYGFYLAYQVYDASTMYALFLISINIYLLYESLSNWDHE